MGYARPRWNVGLTVHDVVRVLRIFGRVLRLPFILPFITFLFTYAYAVRYWCGVYDCNGLWKPAFPSSWRNWTLALAAVTFTATLWLVILLGWEAMLWWSRTRKGRYVRSRTGSPRVSEDEAGEGLLPDDERPSSPPLPTSRRRALRTLKWPVVFWWLQIVLYASISFVGIWEATHYEHPNDVRFRPALQHALADATIKPTGYGKGEKIFIAAAFSSNKDVLPYWISTFTAVITYLGTANVFVSIVESHSNDNSAELLLSFSDTLTDLGVAHRILVRDDDAIERPADLSFNNRINFLAAIRNRVLEPLVQYGGYDRVLFSNDVFVEPESVIELIETDGGKYDMACALDFNHFGGYDAWVLRDRLGHLTSTIWPYFIDKPSIERMYEDAPVPVFTCWNGMVVFSADPLLPISLRSNHTLSTAPLPHALPSTHPAARNPALLGPSPALTPPLRFRASDRDAGECFSSESFLLPYDFRRMFNLQRVLVNPRVVTSYGWKFYVWYKWVLAHRAVRWWVRDVYGGAWMERAKMVVGNEADVWVWDGGDCHPWW